MNKIKTSILYIISSLDKQGPVQVLYDIIANIDFDKFNVTVVTLKKENANSIINKFESLPIKILKLDNNKCKFNFFYYYRKIIKYVRENNVDIVHAHCLRSLLILFSLKKDIKSFFTIHNNLDIKTTVIMNGYIFGYFISYLSKFVIKRIDYPVACSSSIAESLRVNDNIKVEFITNGISDSSVMNKSKNDIRKKIGLNLNLKYFLSVGRFSPEKNFEVLVKSFINANISNAKLIILGEGKTFEQIQLLSNDQIILTGFKDNVNEYLAACDFYISTSLTEGMPLSVLEAMSYGLPLLLSNIPSHKEIIGGSKENKIGIIFPPKDINSISNGIYSILNYDYNSMHENVKTAFMHSFTSDRMSREYQKLYSKI